MRLRARVTDIGLLTGLAQTASNVSPRSFLQFTPDYLRLICPNGRDGIQIWATLPVSALFAEYRVESNRNNEVTLEVATEALARVLRSAAGALDLVLRLGKRNGEPLLSMAIAMSSHSGSRLDVTQDILIRILRTSELNLITEPMCPPPDVYITLPPLAEVRAVAEQMRPMSSEVCLAANQQGTFRLAVLDSEVVGDASWSDLEMPRVQGMLLRSVADRTGRDTGIGTSSREFHEVRLSMRALQNVLSSASVAKSTIACLCADYCIVLYVYLTGQPERSANNSVTGVLNVCYCVPIGCLNLSSLSLASTP